MYQISGLYRFSFGQGMTQTNRHPHTYTYAGKYRNIPSPCSLHFIFCSIFFATDIDKKSNILLSLSSDGADSIIPYGTRQYKSQNLLLTKYVLILQFLIINILIREEVINILFCFYLNSKLPLSLSRILRFVFRVMSRIFGFLFMPWRGNVKKAHANSSSVSQRNFTRIKKFQNRNCSKKEF